jgi:hypothetical protein
LFYSLLSRTLEDVVVFIRRGEIQCGLLFLIKPFLQVLSEFSSRLLNDSPKIMACMKIAGATPVREE